MGAKAVIIDHEPLMAAQLKKNVTEGENSYRGESDML